MPDKLKLLMAYVVLLVVTAAAIHFSSVNTEKTVNQASAKVTWVNEVKACQRGNSLRGVINQRANSWVQTRSVLVNFLRSAAKARRAAYRESHQKTDLIAARAYGRQLKKELKLRFVMVPVVNCLKVDRPPAILGSHPDRLLQ